MPVKNAEIIAFNGWIKDLFLYCGTEKHQTIHSIEFKDLLPMEVKVPVKCIDSRVKPAIETMLYYHAGLTDVVSDKNKKIFRPEITIAFSKQ